MHHEKSDQNLVDGIPEGQFCDHFLVFCPGKPQIRALSNLLIRWQELGYTRGLEVVPMYSGESPETWQYFDLPVSGSKVFGKQMPYYLSEYGISQLRGHEKDGVRTSPPIAKTPAACFVDPGVQQCYGSPGRDVNEDHQP